ncbi:MAG: HD domain-containing protein [Halanaerobacter sp.]
MDLKQIQELMLNLSGRIYLVGGVLRDYLLDKEIRDIDLVVKGSSKKAAEEFAYKVEGSFVVLDEQRAMYRVVNDGLIYDFSDLSGAIIQDDLSCRDFTINALALKLDKIAAPKDNLIDPYGGLRDLKDGLLRVVTKRSFINDPLRVLRMLRFKAQLQFDIVEDTKSLAQKAAHKVVEVANERIKEELVKICSHSGAADNLNFLAELGVISDLIPQSEKLQEIGECKYHQEDVWLHSLTAIKEVEELLTTEYWSDMINEAKIPLLKLAALVHDYGKLFTERESEGEVHFYGHQKVGKKRLEPILKDLSFSNQELDYILKLVRYHMRPFNLYQAENLTFKGKYRFFKDAEGFLEDICLLSAADKLSTAKLNDHSRNIQGFLDFLEELIAAKEEFVERGREKLISGDDLIDEFGLEEGPKIGDILAEVERLQAAGRINSCQEALDYVKKNLIK